MVCMCPIKSYWPICVSSSSRFLLARSCDSVVVSLRASSLGLSWGGGRGSEKRRRALFPSFSLLYPHPQESLLNMIPVQNIIPKRVITQRVHPGRCNVSIIVLFRYEHSHQYHVNDERSLASSLWNRSLGSLQRMRNFGHAIRDDWRRVGRST